MTPTEFVNRLANHYGFADVANPKGLVDDYVAALAGTDPDVLRKASDRLLTVHTFRNWPTVGECIAMINVVATHRMSDRKLEPIEARPEQTPEQRARVAAMVAGFAATLTDTERVQLPNDRNTWAARGGST